MKDNIQSQATGSILCVASKKPWNDFLFSFGRMKKEFKQLLEEMGCVTPGKGLGEVKVLFLGRECFENLSEQEVQDIYDLHQREIILKAKKNFQELLLERADLFYQFR